MRISPITASNYSSNCASAQRKAKNSDPNFQATLHVSSEVEDFMRLQALEASHGDSERYKELMYGFGKTMVDLHERIKPLPGCLTVMLNHHLVEFINEPVENRGVYYGPQLALIKGLPIPETDIPCHSFTYNPYEPGLVDELHKASIRLLTNGNEE